MLLTKAILARLPPLESQASKGMEAIVQVCFFTPSSYWTWWAVEYDPKTQIFFGLVQGDEREMGYFSLKELESIRGPLGLGVERNLHWTPKPLREVMEPRKQ